MKTYSEPEMIEIQRMIATPPPAPVLKTVTFEDFWRMQYSA